MSKGMTGIIRDAVIHYAAGELAKQDNFSGNHPMLIRTRWHVSYGDWQWTNPDNDQCNLKTVPVYFDRADHKWRVDVTYHEGSQRVAYVKWLGETPMLRKPQPPEGYGEWS